jgi:hypothetical protein
MTVETQAQRCDAIAVEAEKLVAHARIAAIHFRNSEVPRGAAHVLAAEGHLLALRSELDAILREHAARSQPVIG